MARILVVLVVSFLSAKLFAEDAIVLPARVWRLTNYYTHTTANKSYNRWGEKTTIGTALGSNVKALRDQLGANSLSPKTAPELTVDRLDMAVEYGVTNKASLQIQLPFYLSAKLKVNPNQDMVSAMATISASPMNAPGKVGELFAKLNKDGTKAATLGDTTIGLKYQWFNNGKMRWSNPRGTRRAAVATGLRVPTGSIQSPDTNDISTTTTSDTKTWIIGARTYWDYYLSEIVYLNLYTEHEYRFSGDRKYLSTPTSTTYNILNTKYRPGIFNHVEVDTHYVPALAEHLNFDSGVILSGDSTSRGEYTNVPGQNIDDLNKNQNSSHQFNVTVYAGAYCDYWMMPLRLKLGRSFALAGRNRSAITETFYSALYLHGRF
jgi:hypothetical protein